MMQRKLRIAVFHCGFVYSGGGERIVLEEVEALRRMGHEVACFAPTLDRARCYPDLIGRTRIRTFLPQLPKWFPLRDAQAMAFSSVLAPLFSWRFRKFDAFVGANQPGAWIAYCVAKVLHRPYVVYLNQPNRLIYPRRIDQETGWLTKPDYHVLDVIIRRLKRFVTWADGQSIRGARVILANGSYIARVIRQVYGIEPVVCPAGCHPRPWSSLGLDRRTPYQGSFDVGCFTIRKPYVLITNRHEPQKKFEFVIEALARVATTVPAADLVIPGNFTAHTPKLASLAAKLGLSGRILFLGRISEQDLQRLYQEAAIYCYPAPEEDFGMGVIEAMAWGVPVVAWNHAGPTVTVEDGVTGFLADPYDVWDYARGIRRLLVDQALRARMGSAGRIRAERLFTWERHSQILESALWQALGEPAARPAVMQSMVARGGDLVGAQLSGPELGPR